MPDEEAIAYRRNFLLAPIILSLMCAGGLVGLVANVVAGGPWWILVLWLMGVGWMSFGHLRVAYAVTVEGGRLHWKGYFREESVLLTEIVSVRSISNGQIEVVECADGRKLPIGVFQRYKQFVQAINQAYPGTPFSVSAYAEFIDKMRF